MTSFAKMSREELEQTKFDLEKEYAAFKARGVKLNMARGKPSDEQLELSRPLLCILDGHATLQNSDNIDARNYGCLEGLTETRELMAVLLDDKPENIIIGGNSSLSLMYDALSRIWMFGTDGHQPWCKLDSVKWICLTPGYDRHFSITEAFGITMIAVPLLEDGPNMDQVEALVASDASIKGIWCVPKYSNPSGISYSDEVVKRLAAMPCAAPDFRIFWDNAYGVHHLFDDTTAQDSVLDIAQACEHAGHTERYLKFASTSKVTFPGAGIAALAASPKNLREIKKIMSVQTIGADKLNQLRHARFLQDATGIAAHMKKHAAILRPKFELVEQKLSDGLKESGCAHWTRPRGGYFVSFTSLDHTAQRIVELAAEAGVVLTSAGATWPGGQNPADNNIRIAPTLPSCEDLSVALDIFVCCVKLASLERLLKNA